MHRIIAILIVAVMSAWSSEVEVSFDKTTSGGQPWDSVISAPSEKLLGKRIEELVKFDHVSVLQAEKLKRPEREYIEEVHAILKTVKVAELPEGRVALKAPFQMYGLWREDAMVGYIYTIGDKTVLTFFEDHQPINLYLTK